MDYTGLKDNATGAGLSREDQEPDVSLASLISMTVYMGFLAITGLIGNTLVIVSVAMSSRLHNSSYALIVNLSVADLSVNVIAIPLISVSFFNYGWPASNFWCRCTFYVIVLFVGISILTITLIAANRYVLIAKPRRSYQKVCGLRVLALLIPFVWCSSVFLVALPELGFGVIHYDPLLRVCSVDNSNTLAFWYAASLLIVGAFSGFVLTPVLYFLTFRAVSHSKRRIWAAQNDPDRSGSEAHGQQRVLRPSEIRLTKLMAVIYVALMVCWTPLSVLHFFKQSFAVPVVLQRLALMLMLTNSSVNPFLYARLNPNIRRVYKSILHCGQQYRGSSLNGAV